MNRPKTTAESGARDVERTSRDRSLDLALARWIQILGPNVDASAATTTRAGTATTGVRRNVPVVLKPTSAEQVAACVGVAQDHGIALYPVSTGRNWGYGCSTPVTDGSALLDLSGMNRVLGFDEALGTVTVEPGVTQQQLRRWLDERGLNYLVPVTGAGPDCSVLGNALERGYGLTPHADHLSALQSLEAVLPDGSRYRSPLRELGADPLGSAFKWGLGPYLDGLFGQSGLGVVTQATFALCPRPERVEAFFFSIEHDELLEAASEAVRSILRDLPGLVSGINLFNRERALSMLVPYPHDRTRPGEPLPQAVVADLAKQNQVAAWTGVGGLYGTKRTVAAARAEVKRRLGRIARRKLFVSEGLVRTLRQWLGSLPGRGAVPIKRLVDTVASTVAILDGRPSDVALPLAYWRSGQRPAAGQPYNPTTDGCGLLWHAPLVPMTANHVRAHVDLVRHRCHAHGLDALITLTSVNDRCFDSSVPLLFDRADQAQTKQALACQADLVAAGRPLGLVPYRVGAHAMGQLVSADISAFRLGALIKSALDPNHVLSPGRYTLLRDEMARSEAESRVRPTHADATTRDDRHVGGTR